MSRLFIELYLDEDVDVLLVNLLRARGFHITTTQEAGNIGKTDAEQLEYAALHDYVLLTHNRADFEILASTCLKSGLKHGGIIISTRRTPYEIARRLLVILNHVTADEIVNQLRYI